MVESDVIGANNISIQIYGIYDITMCRKTLLDFLTESSRGFKNSKSIILTEAIY